VRFKPIFNPTLLVVALVYGFLLEIAARARLAGFLMWLIVTLSLFRYAYHVLQEVARGRTAYLSPPDIESTNIVGEFVLAMHCALYVLTPVMLVLMPRIIGEGSLAELIRTVGLLVVIGTFPASVAIMAMTRNIETALNPVSIARVIAVLRSRYALLLLWCAVIVVITSYLEGQLASGYMTRFIAQSVGVWGFLALFAIIGAAIGQHSADFGFQVEEEIREQRARGDREHEWQSALDRAYASLRSGFVTESYGTIKQLIGSERESLDVYQWVFNKMLDWEDRKHAVELARPFIVRLLEEKQHRAALALVDQCRKLAPDFVPPSEAIEALSAYARTIGRRRLAEELAAVSPRAPTP
jgi:hypothetical protein